MEEELVVKVDATTVEAPTTGNVVMDAPVEAPVAGNVVMDAPVVNMSTQPVEFTSSPGNSGVEEAGSVIQDAAPEPQMEVLSQQDYFASAFQYQPTVPENQNQGADFYGYSQNSAFQGSSQSNGFQGSSYQGNNLDGGFQGNDVQGTGYEQSGYFGGAANGYYGSNQGYYGYATPQNNYGGNMGGYGNGQAGYSGKNDPYGSYNPGEYSQPDIYGQDVYANDPFAAYYDDDEPKRQGNGLAIAALVCGIASLSFACSYLGFIPGIIAIVLGNRGASECENKTMAKTGMILGICGVVAGVIMIGSFILRITTGILENI